MVKKTLILLVFFFCQVNGWMFGAIPAEERAALIAFYSATNGDTWSTNYGWRNEPLEADGFGPIGSEGNWYGITVSGDHVTEISMPWFTYLKGTIPPEVGNLAYLERLDLNGDPVTWCSSNLGGGIPPELGNLKNLRYLDLSRNQFHGNIPEALGNMSKLQTLNLGFNRLSGSIPIELGNLSVLKILCLRTNQLSGNLPPALGNLSNLEYLELNFNRLIGSIPEELGNIENLISLSLSSNSLSGNIPPELGNLINLNCLYLDNNQLTGIIPPGLGNLVNLYTIDLSCNQLTGIIPPELGNLVNLNCLYLYNNQLTGIIPPGLGNLGELQSLSLSDNYLSGCIPQQLAQLTKLDYFSLGSNQLVGEIPPGFINMTKLSYLAVEYNGLFTNDESLRTLLNRINPRWESTQTVAPTGLWASGIDTSTIKISWTPIRFTDAAGGYKVYYSIRPGGPWAYAGMTPDKLMSSYIVSGLLPGTKYYLIVKAQTDPHTENHNRVTSTSSEEVYARTLRAIPGVDQHPFGIMELPIGNGEPQSGSIAVSGWALDDIEVVSVKIYRLEGDSKVYIGDAVFVEGARPAVEHAYPWYPNNSRAGWGYLLLTNMLPNGGNGYFALQATAADDQGKETILGTRTIFCDNIGAVNPFGAIDTPKQGGTASGSDFVNFGWALPTLANFIPTDGSTINVWVDGVPLGHPVYNRYRKDIAALFPYYNNSNGAGGYFYLDTTQYENGLHTIAWSVTDEVGNTGGIGSRYFSIQNTSQSAGSRAQSAQRTAQSVPGAITDISKIPIDYSKPVRVKKGYNPEIEPQTLLPDENGQITIEIKELERVEIQLSNSQWIGFQVIGSQLRSLPIGSFLDIETGIFSWTPGPGHYGLYTLLFLEKIASREVCKKYIQIRILPKFGDDLRK